MNIVFMGTPDFAVPTLKSLLNSSHNVVGVFCQPDKAKGRGHKLQMPPVKELALSYNIPVFQPNHFSDEGIKDSLESLQPDLIIVIAYGKLLPSWVLDLAHYGCINLHGSLLPAYRGASPIQWSILNGDRETGITVIQMNEEMDCGDVLKMIKVPIYEDETSGDLFDRLSLLGGDIIIDLVNEIERKEIYLTPQDHTNATYTKKITKDMGLVDWNRSAKDIFNQIRGLSPWPGTYTFLNGTRIKLWKSCLLEKEYLHTSKDFPAGTIMAVHNDCIDVMTGNGILRVFEVQMDNRKRMLISEFLKGYTIEKGQQFTGEPCSI